MNLEKRLEKKSQLQKPVEDDSDASDAIDRQAIREAAERLAYEASDAEKRERGKR